MKKRTSSIWMAITLVAGAATFGSLGGRSLDGRWGGNPALAEVIQTGSQCNSEVEACPKVDQASRNREDNAPRAILQAYERTKEDIAS